MSSYKLWGFGLDDWLGYSTKKVAFVRDQYVGSIYYVLMITIACWVFFGQILWNNEDFLYQDVSGIARMWMSHPTLDQCDPSLPNCKSNFVSLLDIPYCQESRNATARIPEAQHCKYQGKNSIAPYGEVDDKLFIPTAIELITEKKACEPTLENGYYCENEFVELQGTNCDAQGYKCTGRGGKTGQYFYVADVENVVVQFTSSYDRDGISGTSLAHKGYYYECEDGSNIKHGEYSWEQRMNSSEKPNKGCSSKWKRKTILCRPGYDCHGEHTNKPDHFLPDRVKHLAGSKMDEPDFGKVVKFLDVDSSKFTSSDQRRLHTRPRHSKRDDEMLLLPAEARGKDPKSRESPEVDVDAEGLWASPWGDTFTVKKILELAGISNLDSLRNHDGWTARQHGTVIEVKVIYNNMYRLLSNMGYNPVEYTYQVHEMPMPFVSKQVLAVAQPPEYPNLRNYEIHHGILIWFKVGGQFGVFNFLYLLIMLTTAFALFTAATAFTDFLAIYVHPKRKNYFRLKYEVSPTFEKLWQCQTCNFYNKPEDSSCQGLDRWESSDDTDVCGCARP